MSKANLQKAKNNFVKEGQWDVHKFYDRVIRLSTNIDETLYPTKKHARDLSVYKTEAEYLKSFTKIEAFSKKFTEKQKQSFDTIIYHKSNSDGVIAAYLTWDYLTKGGEEDRKIAIYRMLPNRQKFGIDHRIQKILPELEGKNVFMTDLAYNKDTYEAIKKVTNLFIVIDDHPNINVSGLDYLYQPHSQKKEDQFHAAAALTWKFFYPDKDPPYFVQYVDSGDAFLNLSYLPQINAFQTAMAVRYVKNQKRKNYESDPIVMFKDLHDLFKGKSTQGLNFLVVLGNIMNRYRENMKVEIGSKAYPATFYQKNGTPHKILVINYSQPGLLKAVLKFVATNGTRQGARFAVAWFYNYRERVVDVSLSNDHINPGGLSMKVLAQEYGGDGKVNWAHFKIKGGPGDIQKIVR